MVRKRRTPLPSEGQSSGSQETAAGRGAGVQQQPQGPQQPQQPLQQPQQVGYQAGGGRGSTSQRGGYAGRGGVPLPSAGQSSGTQKTAAGRGAGGQQQPQQPQPQQPPPREGYAAGRGGVPLQQQYGGPSEYQQGTGSRQYQQEDAPQGSGGPPSGVPSRSPVSQVPPDILKFGTVNIGSLGESQDEAGPSSSAPKPASPNVVQQQTSILEPDVAPSQDILPASSKSMRLPLRPGKGRLGIKCIVTANHFYAELPDKDLHQYDVSIVPEVKSRRVNRIVMRQLVENYRVPFLGERLPAYDGRKSLYTAGPLPFVSEDFDITIVHEQDGGVGKEQEFKVQIKFASRPSLYHLSMFLEGRQEDAPKEVFQALDIVLCEGPNRNDGYRPLGRCFYKSNLATRLDGRLEIQRGFCQSFRPTQMGLSLNFDLCSAIFIKPLPVLEFVKELLQREVSGRPLSEVEHEKVNRALRGIKVETTHRGNVRRKYPVSEITKKATRELRFPDKETGEQKSVVEYFRETYGTLRYAHLPCLQIVDKKGRTIYLPMEVCKIMKGQRYSKGLLRDQKNALSMKPYDRQQFVLQYLRNNNYRADLHAQEFGIRIEDELTRVEARILPAPRLKFNDLGKEKGISPTDGKWTMWNKRLFDGGTVKNWTCLNLSPDDDVYDFCNKLVQKCRTSGMNFNPTPVLRPKSVLPGEFKRALVQLQNVELDLLIVILPDNNGSLYGNVKRICDTELGIVSQCCLRKHVVEKKIHYLGNVALKINVKVGGRNVVLVDALEKSLPLLRNTPTIIFGADVTHPDPGDKSSPSIAAVVASQDWPEVSKYTGLVSAQENRKELIQDLYQESARGVVSVSMIRELLIAFSRATGLKPQRIIFYRDGVSEGQFNQVLSHEVGAIKKACSSLETNYNPKVTFVVVQKRHRTRLFADYNGDQNAVDENENIRPGTVVDSTICHPTQFDFYLCSHAGTKGTTSRPAHYHVLWDENNFTADDLQSLTYKLCYTFARCTQSVSIVPPAYYADLLAYRARKYIEKDKPFPSVKEKLKKFMFYC